MPSIKVTNLQGETNNINFETGLSLMEVLRDADYDEIQAICGGCCSCATCHVHIIERQNSPLPIVEEDELALLELADGYQADRSRLSCQIELGEQHDGLKVILVDTD